MPRDPQQAGGAGEQTSATSPGARGTLAERFCAWLHRYRWWLLGLWVVHAFLIHLFLLGYMSWDGMGYRGVPVVEIAQHWTLDTTKYSDWSYMGYIPFVELANVPFTWLLGLPGMLVGFGLVLFPLCVAGVYVFARELTGDRYGGLFGALAYAAMPMFNAQPFGGYVDFAICALLAIWLFSILRLRRCGGWRGAVVVAIATAAFTMSRIQGVYVVILLLPPLCYAMFCTRAGWRVQVENRRSIALACGGSLVGAIPAIGIQIGKFVRHGTPTYPLQFKVLGMTIGKGVPLKNYFIYAGLKNDSVGEQARAFVRGWIGSWHWPIGGFYDSRYSGAGLVFCLAVLLLVPFLLKASRVERWLIAACASISLLAHDFVHPRWSYTISLAVIMVIARVLPGLARSRRWSGVFWAASVVLLLHGLRPEVDLMQVDTNVWTARLNVERSPYIRPGQGLMQPFPDLHAHLVIVGSAANDFVLPLFGKRITNEVIATVSKQDIGPHCANLLRLAANDPEVLFVDDLDLTNHCPRVCAIELHHYCRAYRLVPKRSATAPPTTQGTSWQQPRRGGARRRSRVGTPRGGR